jgi:hypothetical protein
VLAFMNVGTTFHKRGENVAGLFTHIPLSFILLFVFVVFVYICIVHSSHSHLSACVLV